MRRWYMRYTTVRHGLRRQSVSIGNTISEGEHPFLVVKRWNEREMKAHTENVERYKTSFPRNEISLDWFKELDDSDMAALAERGDGFDFESVPFGYS